MRGKRNIPLLLVSICLLITIWPSDATAARNLFQVDPSAGCWQVVPTPNTSTTYPGLFINGLAALSKGDIWAVGGSSGKQSAVAMHYDGAAWSVVPTPVITQPNQLANVFALSPTDVWAIGSYDTRTQSTPFDAETVVGMVFHWDGKQWQKMDIPNSPAPNGVWASARDDVWVVGDFGHGRQGNASWAMHWDGRQWSRKQPDVPYLIYLNGVTGTSANDVWAVGSDIVHWDGAGWKQTLTDSVPIREFKSVVALSPDNVWAVGNSRDGRVATAHWDGVQWTQAPGAAPANGVILNGITVRSPSDIWAVGTQNYSDALVMHWDGNTWKGIPNPVPGFRSELWSLTGADGDLWAAGIRTISAAPLPDSVLMHYTNDPCPSSGPQKPLNPPVPLPGTGSQQFITGESANGIFLKYWQEHGGLAQQGYPISDVLGEQSDLDGRIYTVQYFERAAFEYHPENKGTPYEVLLAQLGTFQYKQKYPNGAPNQRANQDRGTLFFPETGKHLGGTFLKYWQEHGGLAQQGYPISEEFTEVSDLNGKVYTVQYFERAVFEWHPENTPPFNVLLSQLGHFRYFNKYTLQQSQTTPPRRIADSILPNTLRGAGNYLAWFDVRNGDYYRQTIYAYNASQNREQPISEPLPGGMPLATNGTLAFWTRPDIDRRYLEGYNLTTGTAARVDQPSTVSSPDFRRSDNIALDQTTLYYVDNWAGHTGIFAYDLITNAERRIYDKVPVPGSLVASDGALLWTEEVSSGTNKDRTLRLYRASNGAVITLSSGIGGFTGYGVSGNSVVYSFYGTIASQTTYLYNMDAGVRKVVAFGAASNPVIQGKRIAWVRWPSVESGESDGWKIETYNIDTGAVQTVASGLRAMPRNIVLLKGDKLAFAADNDLSSPGSELYILELAKLP